MVGANACPLLAGPAPGPIAVCLAVLTAPLGKVLTRPVPHAAVFDLALESTGYGQWPAGQAPRPGVPGVKVANPYPKGI